MNNYRDNLNGGTRSRLAKMRHYVDQWNMDGKRTTKLGDWKQARLHGVGAIKVDAHGPTYSALGDYASIPLSVLEGLRDVGSAGDVLGGYRCGGWFTDEDAGETYTGHVWQLPARGGEPVYIAGYTESSDTGYAVLDCSLTGVTLFDSKEDAARAGDALAERMAERERDYNAGWREAQELSEACDELREQLRTIRKDAANAAMVYGALPSSASAAREFTLSKFWGYRMAFSKCLAQLIEKRAEFNAHPQRGDA